MSRPITFVDLYCGCGGMSTGAHEAFHELGLPFREIAINHWLRAIQTMQANHPDVLAKNDGIDSALYRIHGLMAADKRAVPFVMPYRSLTDNSIVPSPRLRALARWCNRAWIRKSCEFEGYR